MWIKNAVIELLRVLIDIAGALWTIATVLEAWCGDECLYAAGTIKAQSWALQRVEAAKLKIRMLKTGGPSGEVVAALDAVEAELVRAGVEDDEVDHVLD